MSEKKNKILKFDLSSDAIQVRNILQQQFLNIRIKAISSIYPNRNNSNFSENAIFQALPSFRNKPILCNYLVDQDDASAHDSNGMRYDIDNDIYYEDYESENSEKIVGIIRESDNIEVVYEDELVWVYVDCALFVQYNYRLVKRMLKSKGCRVSVEVEVLDSYIDDNGVEVITEFSLMGISLLGSTVLEAIPGASMTIPELQKTETYAKQMKFMKFAYKQLEETSQPDWKDPVVNEKEDEISFEKTKETSSFNIDNVSNNTENFEKGEVASMDQELNKQTNSSELTMQAKMDLIHIALKEVLKWVWFWISDIDDNYVYYMTEDNDIVHKAPYEIREGGAYVDVEHQEKVVRSWQTYSEDDMKDKKDKKEFDILDPNSVEQNAKDHIVHDDDEAGIQMKMASDEDGKEECAKEDCATEKNCSAEDKEKECGKCSSNEEKCSSDEDDKEECAADNKSGDSSGDGKKSVNASDEDDKEKECGKCSTEEKCAMPDNKSGDSSGDEKKSKNATEDKEEETAKAECVSKEDCAKEDECKMSSDKEECTSKEEETAKAECADDKEKECGKCSSNEEKCSSDESKKETEDCDCDDKEEMAKDENCKMASDEDSKEECSDKETESTVKGGPIISKDTYSKEAFEKLQREHNILMGLYKEKVQNEQLKFAQDFVNAETDLTSENSKNVFSTIEKEIKAEKFTDVEAVKKFAVTEIATALYMQKKEMQKTEKENVNNKSEKSNFSCDVHKESYSFMMGGTDKDIEDLRSSISALDEI